MILWFAPWKVHLLENTRFVALTFYCSKALTDQLRWQKVKRKLVSVRLPESPRIWCRSWRVEPVLRLVVLRSQKPAQLATSRIHWDTAARLMTLKWCHRLKLQDLPHPHRSDDPVFVSSVSVTLDWIAHPCRLVIQRHLLGCVFLLPFHEEIVTGICLCLYIISIKQSWKGVSVSVSLKDHKKGKIFPKEVNIPTGVRGALK